MQEKRTSTEPYAEPLIQETSQEATEVMQFFNNSLEIFNKYTQVLTQLLENSTSSRHKENFVFDPIKALNAVTNVFTDVYSNPHKMLALQRKYVEDSLGLINYTIAKIEGRNPEPMYEPDKRDRRFQYEAWYTNIYFDFFKQLYLLNGDWLNRLIEQSEDVDKKTKRLAEFLIHQLIDAISPTNFLYTNPQALQEGISTNGESILNGLNNLLNDLIKNKEFFDITRTDEEAFTVGENLACTPGHVIYRTDLFELLYYTPEQKEVHDIPLLIIPPWINKYYILDLSQKNSFVKWLVSQGFSVFLISWVNPKTPEQLGKTFDDYVIKGALEAINFIIKRFKKKTVNLLSYCIGGTLTAMLLAYLAKHKKEHLVNTSSFLTTLIDFSETGDLSIFIDEDQITQIEKIMEHKGYFGGETMSLTFSALRANDMIWFFVVNNYLMGKSPLPFDLLYWNADSTHLPAQMHSFYLRNLYLENNLIVPNKMKIAETSLDLSKISTPCHFISTYNDHISPWKTTYKALNVLTCPRYFTLSGSGHVAGIINPPTSQKYNHWTHEETKTFPKEPDAWLKEAKENPGSWWPHWGNWLANNSGNKVATTSQNKIVASLKKGPAPGKYVKETL